MRINRNSEYTNSKLNKDHLKFGLPPAEEDSNTLKLNRKIFIQVFLLIGLGIVFWLLSLSPEAKTSVAKFASDVITSDLFYEAILVGLLAQLVDGSLGMAYGITSTSFLIGIGATPAAASGAVHVAEIFTTAFSGISHIKFGNVHKDLFKKLVIPGVIGGIVGAYILTSIDGKLIKPYITVYLLLMGLFILRKAFVLIKHNNKKSNNNENINVSNYNNFIIVKRNNHIKLIHKKLQNDSGNYYMIKIIEHPFRTNEFYYDMELVGSVEIITNIIKESIRDIKIKQLGI